MGKHPSKSRGTTGIRRHHHDVGVDRIVSEATRQVCRLQLMSHLLDAILGAESLSVLWGRIPEVAAKLFDCESASVSSFDHTTNMLRREATYGMTLADRGESERIREEADPSTEHGGGLFRYLAKVGGMLRLAGKEASTHPHLSRQGVSYHEGPPSRRVNSIMLARLDTPDGRSVGVLRVLNRKDVTGERGFSEFDESLMRLLATKLALAIERLTLIESRTRAITAIAHDLKTPLHNIRVTLDSFLQNAFQLPGNEDDLRTSYNSCKLLDAFILSTIEVAQGKIDPSRVRMEEIDAVDLVGEVIDILRPKFQDPCAIDPWRWEVRTHIANGAKSICGDRQELLRLLLNLLHNAWKHGRANGAALEKKIQQNRLEVTVTNRRGMCRIRVADRGPGWNRGTTENDRDDRGQGVGLASAQLVAEAHGGRLVYGKREDGLSGFQIDMTWDQTRLRKETASFSVGDRSCAKPVRLKP